MNEIIAYAKKLGVSDAKMIGIDAVPIEERFAKLCQEQKCDGFDQSINCPPHVMTPAQFRNHLKKFQNVLAFKFDLPTDVLLCDRNELLRIVHETSASIEIFSKSIGWTQSEGLAGGSCKNLFCSNYPRCVVLAENKPCIFPNQARPSMSGYGVSFLNLCKAAGWENKKNPSTSIWESVGIVAGIVLIG